MIFTSPDTAAPAPPHVAAFMFRVLASCLDIKSVWSIGHEPEHSCPPPGGYALLAFADKATLERLRRTEHLHQAQFRLLVVVDGDLFENAWGPEKLSGSLARWAWRQTSPQEAYYDESHWARGPAAGDIVRVRRKALLLWRSTDTEHR